MSDEKDENQDEAPEGMVRKTRRVRRKRKKKSEPTENADTLFSRAKELMLGMEEERDEYGHVGVAEQLKRLKESKEDDRPLDEVWGTKRRSTSWLWLMLIGVITPIIAIVAGVVILRADDDDPSNVDIDPEFGKILLDEFDPKAGPLGWYNDNSIEVLAKVRTIIHAVNEAESPDEIQQYLRVRDQGNQVPIELEKWGVARLTKPSSNFKWELAIIYPQNDSTSEGRGILIVTGTRKNFSPYTAYFVEENGEVLLDWNATIGKSEKSIEEIKKEMPRKPTLVRCLLSKKAVFDQDFGEIPHSGYVLSDEETGEHLFAYLPIRTEDQKKIDLKMRKHLNYGAVDGTPIRQNSRATVRVRRGDSSGDTGYFQITEFVNTDWVAP